DFHDHVHGNAEPFGRREAPLAHRADRPIVETRPEAVKEFHLADRAITPHDDFEHDFAGERALPRGLGVVGFDFAQQPRRGDAAAGTVRSAARPAARSGTDAGPAAFAQAGAR